MWPDYNDYIDGATKATLANIQNQTDKTQGGSDSVEIAGPARIAPLIAFLSNSSENELVKAAVEQTVLTHRVQGGRRNCHLSCSGRLSSDARIQPASIPSTKPLPSGHSKRQTVCSQKMLWTRLVNLGPACSISSALPSVLYLATKHGDDTETAFIENAMAGGDNCARGLALGILLGSANGLSSIPESWIENLESQITLNQFLEQVSQISQTEKQSKN